MQKIGIFDSGLGGLTAFRWVETLYPHLDIVYFGDTARLPYGPKSQKTIIQYAEQNIRFLRNIGAEAVIIACNTASAFAGEIMQERFPFPICGVIDAGAQAAVAATRNRRIGIIGTYGTIDSNAYGQAIQKIDDSIDLISQPCPLFVSFVEEGWLEKPATKLVAEEYLAPLLDFGVDTIVLGCTHYPLLTPLLQSIVPKSVRLIDPAQATVKHFGHAMNWGPASCHGKREFFVSDFPAKFSFIAQEFLGYEPTQVRLAHLGEMWCVSE